MIITSIETFTVTGPPRQSDPQRPRWSDARQVVPLDIYGPSTGSVITAEASEATPGNPTAAFVTIGTDTGLTGIYGPIGTPSGQASAITTDLAPLLLGQDPLATELLHDRMFRQDRHGRSGAQVTALSALDCALWDLKGKHYNEPVYRLLGGPTRTRVPAYASMLGHSIAPDEAAAAARETMAEGFQAQKWFFHFGPGDGSAGLEQNIAMATAVRNAVGPYYRLMFDAFMGWDLPYAMEMVRALEPLNPFWMEEPLAPEHGEGFRRLRRSGSVPLATGEHVYGRWQTRELLASGSVDVLQNDPDWTGGITELVKIIALASSHDVPVIAHGHSVLPALHVAASQSPAAVPMVEFLLYHQEASQHFFTTRYRPEEGFMALPTLPGIGIALDSQTLAEREILTRVE